MMIGWTALRMHGARYSCIAGKKSALSDLCRFWQKELWRMMRHINRRLAMITMSGVTPATYFQIQISAMMLSGVERLPNILLKIRVCR